MYLPTLSGEIISISQDEGVSYTEIQVKNLGDLNDFETDNVITGSSEKIALEINLVNGTILNEFRHLESKKSANYTQHSNTA